MNAGGTFPYEPSAPGGVPLTARPSGEVGIVIRREEKSLRAILRTSRLWRVSPPADEGLYGPSIVSPSDVEEG